MLRQNSVPVSNIDCQCSPLVVHVGHFTSSKERLEMCLSFGDVIVAEDVWCSIANHWISLKQVLVNCL